MDAGHVGDRCQWCGSTDRTLTTAYSGRAVLDARQPSIPRMNLCVDCSEVLTDYMRARAMSNGKPSEDLRTLAGHEIESILATLEENKGLEAVTPSWLRVRRNPNSWMKIQVITGDFVFSEIGREEAARLLSHARKISLRPASTKIWGDYEDPEWFET